MNSKLYKYCVVPLCPNTTNKSPQKLFIHVPIHKEIRKQWFRLAGRDESPTATNVYYCEDHFDMPNDMENFIEYNIMGSVSKVRMKPDRLPTKFDCQPDREPTQPTSPTTVKRRRQSLIEVCIKDKDQNEGLVNQSSDEDYEVPTGYSDNVVDMSSEAPVQMEVVYVKQEPAWQDGAAGAGVGSYQECIEPTWQDGAAGAGASSYQECRAQQDSAVQYNSAPRTPAPEADPLATPKPYSCDTCTKQFKTLSHLKKHALTHSERPFNCRTCRERFRLYNDLKFHQCTSGQELYACKTGNNKCTHAGDKPYSCNMCDTTFTHPHNLEMHCQKHGTQDVKCSQVYKSYKCCAVPLCASSSDDTPEKLFIHIPRGGDRERWLRAAGRDPAAVAPRSTLYFCEDHFDMPKDMVNYTQYRVMGSVARVKMRPGCCPTKFACQQDRRSAEVQATGTSTSALETKRLEMLADFDKGVGTDFTLNMFEAEEQAANTGSTAELEVKGDTSELYAGHEVRGELVLGPVGVRGVDDLAGGLKQEPVWETDQSAQEVEVTNTCVAVKTEPTGEGPGGGEEGRGATRDTPATKPPRAKVTYTCSTCSRQFTRGSQYYEHLRVHTGERPYACDICNQRFKQLSTMKVHRRIHTGELPFSCNTCQKSFLRLKGLQCHERTHTGEKPYSCDTCNLRFAELSYLKVHEIRMHTGERPYSCERCSKAYGTAKDLSKHKRRHDREKTYKCDICEKVFKTIGGLSTHERWIHSKSKQKRLEDIT